MTLVSGDIRLMQIFAEVPWGGERQMIVGLSTMANFSVFAGCFFGNRDETSVYYTAIRSLSSAFIDRK